MGDGVTGDAHVGEGWILWRRRHRFVRHCRRMACTQRRSTLTSGALPDVNDKPINGWPHRRAHRTDPLDLTGGLLAGETVSISGGTFNFAGRASCQSMPLMDCSTRTAACSRRATRRARPPSTATLAWRRRKCSKVRDLRASTFDATTHRYDRLAVNGAVDAERRRRFRVAADTLDVRSR